MDCSVKEGVCKGTKIVDTWRELAHTVVRGGLVLLVFSGKKRKECGRPGMLWAVQEQVVLGRAPAEIMKIDERGMGNGRSQGGFSGGHHQMALHGGMTGQPGKQ